MLPEIILHIHPESKDHIQYERRPEREKRDIDKPKPYAGGSNSQSFSYCAADAEGLPFNKIFKLIQRVFHDFSICRVVRVAIAKLGKFS